MDNYNYESNRQNDILTSNRDINVDKYLYMEYEHNLNSTSEQCWVDEADDITEEEMEAFRALQENPEHQNRVLGMHLHDERKALGMSQKYVSEKIGISVDTISRLEKGHTNFRKATLDKVKLFLGIEE
ncbi:transcriptional regulator [Virgibacillus sp. SK37]|uniref:transcriptional regulator n=1 Tax=Virgibacillus sp. SK37 TaxID=403957 RepID=UPI0004D101F3|nr:transcriptional regulator [Virgibacillus sp. SK37]AIF44984.1 DNA-binding protein [Virgibacillus sp. SK37]